MQRGPLVFIAVVFLLVGALLTAIGGTTVWEDVRYRTSGSRAPAAILGKVLHRATAGTSTVYEISYRATLAGDRAVDRTERVPVHVWERVEPRAPVEVEYLAGEPQAIRIVRDMSADRRRALIFLAIGAVVLLIGVAAAVGAVRVHPPDPGAAASTPPALPEPSGSFWAVLRQFPAFWVGGTFAGVAMALLLGGVFLFYDDWRFGREAVPARAMVLTKEISSQGTGRSRSRQYDVTYRYEVGGRTFEGRDQISRAAWERLIERELVDARYRSRHPASSHLAVHGAWFVKTILTVLGLIFVAIGASLCRGAIRNARLAWRLQLHGVTVPGRVIEVRPRNLKINDEWQVSLHFEYTDSLGVRRTNASEMGAQEAQQWKVGDTGQVSFDPSQPDHAMWLGRP